MRRFIISAFIAAASQNVFAICFAPSSPGSAPSEPLLFKPSVPFCLSGYKYSKKHSCSKFEIDNYLNAVKQYLATLDEYSSESREFANKAIKYSNAVLEYSNCEAKEVTEELK